MFWFHALAEEITLLFRCLLDNCSLVLTRIVRGSDYSPAIALSEEKDKLVTENWRDRKRRNSGTHKYEQPDSSIHDTLTDSSFLYYVSTVYASQFLRKV